MATECACGCGQLFSEIDHKGRQRKYLPGHNFKKDGKHHDVNWLKQKYVDEGKSLAEIAKECHVTSQRILFLLKKYGIWKPQVEFGKDRTVDSHHGYVYCRNPGHPRAKASGMVLEHILVAEEILGRPLKPNEVVHHKNRNRTDNRPENLQVTTRSEHRRMHVEMQAKEKWWYKREFLSDLYHNQKLNMDEIAEKIGVNKTQVQYAFMRLKIKTRTPSEVALLNPRSYHNKQWIEEQYLIKKLSIDEIARLSEANHKTIKTWLDKHNIETRSFAESIALRDEKLNRGRLKVEITIPQKVRIQKNDRSIVNYLNGEPVRLGW